MDKAFFGIVRRFGLVVAFLALVSCLGAIAWGVMLYQTPVQRQLATPSLNYSQFKESLRPTPVNETANGSTEQFQAPGSSQRQSKTEFERKFDAFLSQIVINGNRYLSPDFTLREDRIRSACLEMTQSLPQDQHDALALAFMEQFAAASKKFADDPANRANVYSPSDKGDRWQAFINWITSELQRQIQAESERVQQETAKAMENRTQALQVFAMGGVAFIAFVFFTLMLVLIAIERNTRQLATSRADTPTPTLVA